MITSGQATTHIECSKLVTQSQPYGAALVIPGESGSRNVARPRSWSYVAQHKEAAGQREKAVATKLAQRNATKATPHDERCKGKSHALGEDRIEAMGGRTKFNGHGSRGESSRGNFQRPPK